jgi:hypothetical protein
MPKAARASLLRPRDRRLARQLTVVLASAVAVAVLVLLGALGGPAGDSSRPDPGRTEVVSGGLSDDTTGLEGSRLGSDWEDDWFEDHTEGDVLDEEAAEVDVSGDKAVLV